MSDAYEEFQDILSAMNAYMTFWEPQDGLSEMQGLIYKLEVFRGKHLEPEVFEFTNEDCPHDYCISKCLGCGYETG